MALSRLLNFVLAITIAAVPSSSQTTHWGMTSSGGDYGVGTIFNITEAGTFTKKYDFFRNEGISPKSELVKASNNKLYGVTEFGGATGDGIIFSYDPTTGIYTQVFEFNYTAHGSQPYRGLTAVGALLYGTCQFGGANGYGTIFEFDPATSLITFKFDFTYSNGSKPRGRMVLSGTSLYGTTLEGGTGDVGVIYQFNTATHAYNKRKDLQLATGANPIAGLTKPATGTLLYGVTQQGGANGHGVLFSFNTSSPFTYTALYSLNDGATDDGRLPIGELVQASNGRLYGTCSNGGATGHGTIFSWIISPGTFTKHYDMTISDGFNPQGRMIGTNSVVLYGTTTSGGTNDDGVLFSFNTSNDQYTPLINMNDAGLTDVRGGLLEEPAASGIFYGMANDGGTVGNGALFKFTAGTSTLTELVAMGLAVGAVPRGRLVLASNGTFYGLTSAGGTSSTGVIFSYNPTSSTYTKLFDLGGINGSNPLGTMVESGGKLYGLCKNGGANGVGTLFELNLTGNVFTKKLDLSATTGNAPLAGLMKASNGKLYGVTSGGGVNGLGTLFDYVPATNTLTKRVDLSTTTGTQPDADLMQASNGLLYGTCSAEGAFGDGTLFSFDTGTNTFTNLRDFDLFQGGTPSGEIVQTADGKLYGTCSDGAGFLNGCIWSWNIGTNTYTLEYDLQDAEGKIPLGGMLLGNDGNLYGTCSQGGTSDLGTLVRFVPGPTPSIAVQRNLTVVDGQYPVNGLVRDVIPSNPGVQLNLKIFLEGPLNSVTGKMNTVLRTLPDFPTTEPYSTLGFAQAGGGGGETINASVLTTTGDNAIVDWILLELRLGPLPSPIVATRCALLQSDGDVVATDGVSPVTINAPPGSYKIAVRHRNHLAAMTLNDFSLTATPNPLIDLTNGTVPTYGTEAQKTLGTFLALWSGNTVRTTPPTPNKLIYTNADNDRQVILTRIGGVVPTNTVNGYYVEDCNLDGIVSYTNANNDRSYILTNIGGVIPTNTRLEQIP